MRPAFLITLLLHCLAAQGKRWTWPNIHAKQSLGGGVPLRVLLIGDSILVGYASLDFNGFRQHLYDNFVESGSSVDFLGTQSLGPDPKPANHFEGYPGHRLKMLQDRLIANSILLEQPNIILLLAGTNDLNQQDILFSEEEPRTLALYRLQLMLEYLTCMAPEAVLLVADLPPIQNETAQALAVDFNAGIPTVVAPGVSEGFKIGTVQLSDMGPELMNHDGIHPNDDGYKVVADRWFKSLQDLPAGWIQASKGSLMGKGNATADMCAERVHSAQNCPKCEGIWHCLWVAPNTRCGSY